MPGSSTPLLHSKRAELKGLVTEEQTIRDQVARMKEEREELTTGNLREAERFASLQDEIDATRTKLTMALGQRDRAKDELVRATAMADAENSRAEAIAARLQLPTGLEARVRQQIRTMIEELSMAERTRDGSEPRQ